MSLKQNLVEAKDLARMQAKPFAVTVLVVAAVFIGSLVVQPGWFTYGLSVPPLLLIAITALARVNDIGPEMNGWRWHVRRIGLIMAGTGAVMIMGAPFTSAGYALQWRAVVIIWGVAFAWFTTPGLPPWEHYISGTRKPGPAQRRRDAVREFAGRITGQYRVRDLDPPDGIEKRRGGDGGGP